MKKKISEEQFEKEYAGKLGVKKLHALGLFAVPCDCGNKLCKGWTMVSKKGLKNHVELYLKSTE